MDFQFPASLALILSISSTACAADPVWIKDLDEARDVARESKKPLFVVIRCER